MKPTFAQLKGKLLFFVSARVELRTIQKCANVMYKHFVAGHRQLCARAFPFHELEKQKVNWSQVKQRKGCSSSSHRYICTTPAPHISPAYLVLCIR